VTLSVRGSRVMLVTLLNTLVTLEGVGSIVNKSLPLTLTAGVSQAEYTI